MGRNFYAEVLRLEPRLRLIDGQFVFWPVNHIAAGFGYEATPSGAYIWKIAFPLYDRRATNISLTFGDRLPRPVGFLDASLSTEEAAFEFVRRTAPYIAEVGAWQTLAGFLGRVEQLGLTNPWILRAFVATLVMLDRQDEALRPLASLADSKAARQYPGFEADMSALREALIHGKARQLLLAWEAETKRNLRLIV